MSRKMPADALCVLEVLGADAAFAALGYMRAPRHRRAALNRAMTGALRIAHPRLPVKRSRALRRTPRPRPYASRPAPTRGDPNPDADPEPSAAPAPLTNARREFLRRRAMGVEAQVRFDGGVLDPKRLIGLTADLTAEERAHLLRWLPRQLREQVGQEGGDV
jgi:hypothetical protein